MDLQMGDGEDGEDVDVGKHENIRSTGHRTRRPCFQRRPVAVPASETSNISGKVFL